MNKFKAKRTYSELCQRWFSSRAEARRGEELALLERGKVISDLQYQVRFVLSVKPKVTITVDFAYKDENGKQVYEDVKGVLTRDFRSKMAWAKQLHGIEIILSK